MNLGTRIGLGLRSAAARAAGALGAFAHTGIVPGIGRQFGVNPLLPRDSQAQRIIDSEGALGGRVAANLGPMPAHISTHPLRDLTPARISALQNQVQVAGYMVGWSDLLEDLLLGDDQIASAQNTAQSTITSAPFSVEPADGSDAARAVADYQQTVIDSISGWPRAMSRLLVGEAGGYALEDVTYQEKAVRFPIGKSTATVEAWTPVALDFVHNKHTRWDTSGDILELDTSNGFVVPPDHKFVRYEASGGYQVRRRGYAYPAVWLSLIKQNAWARMGVVLDLWGIPVPYGVADQDLWQDDKRKAEMWQSLIEFGRGRPSIFTKDFKIESSPAPSSPLDARGMHIAVIGAINLEISKLILGASLQSEVSGTGSYNASSSHADTVFIRMSAWERNLSAAVQDWQRAALRLACYRFGTEDPLPRGLHAAIGISPEECIALCGRPTWRVARESSSEIRMGLMDDAVNRLGLEVDADQAYREFGLQRARHSAKKLRGAPVTLAGDAATTSTADALDGESNPKPDEAPATPAAMRKRRSRSKKDS